MIFTLHIVIQMRFSLYILSLVARRPQEEQEEDAHAFARGPDRRHGADGAYRYDKPTHATPLMRLTAAVPEVV